MSQKKRKRERERIPALSGSIETPPTTSFQLELKLQHYIIPKTSFWPIIPWEPGTDAAHRVTDVAAGCKFTLLGSLGQGQTEGHPRTPFKTPSLFGGWGPRGPPAFGAMSPPSRPRTPRGHHSGGFSLRPEGLGLAGAGGAAGRRCYLYFRTDPRTRQTLKS